jgi:hypothetical protein
MTITIKQLQQNLPAIDLLADYADLGIYPEEKQQLPSWLDLSATEDFIALGREGSGGVFLLGVTSGQVVYVSSEGRAGCIAASLDDFLQLLIAHPYWQDLLKFSAAGNLLEMQRVAPYLEESLQEDEPDIDDIREELLACLGLAEGEAQIVKLHQAVTALSGKVVIKAEDGSHYQSLFNRFTVDDNPMWKAG